ncbi:MAG: hypothetical protein ACREE6_07165 [Limisphaerales bacterium]
MGKAIELTLSEQRFLKRMKSHVRKWPLYRWVGIVGGVFLLFVGAWGISASFRVAIRENPTSISLAVAMVAALSLAIFTCAFTLVAHIISQWDSHQRDSVLIKLLEANGDDLHKDELGSSS